MAYAFVAVSVVLAGCAGSRDEGASGRSGSGQESATTRDESAGSEGSRRNGSHVDPPRAGRYSFQVTSAGDTETRILVVSEQKFSPAGEHVSLLRETAFGVIQEIYLWRGDDVQIIQMMGTHDTDSNAALRCNWTPPVTYLKLPLSPTTRWTDTTACGGGGPEIERRIETEVRGEASVSTPAGTFDVWTITKRESTTVGSRTSAFEITEHFAPRVGLAVKAVEESFADGQIRSREVRELESLPRR